MAGVPVYLVGPKGSGKSYLAKQVAECLGRGYGECPLTAGATPTWLLGRYVDKYVPSDYVKQYGAENDGGIFCFEEIDSADANMLLVVNNSMANEEFHNPISGETIKRGKNHAAMATANTMGTGATAQYGGREKLDAATRDRWAMGRVYVDIDENLESIIAHESYDAIETI
jgi:MoxR-like ATPase